MVEKLHDIHVMRMADASRCKDDDMGMDSTIKLQQVRQCVG